MCSYRHANLRRPCQKRCTYLQYVLYLLTFVLIAQAVLLLERGQINTLYCTQLLPVTAADYRVFSAASDFLSVCRYDCTFLLCSF